ncbi:MAG: hypothetical protein JNJ88_21445 [Planctomycetes bacterium]|nr:hypothetical protein [Planctomycetota bacterium]
MTAELFLSQAFELRPQFTIPATARGVGHPDEIARRLAEVAAHELEEEAVMAGVPDPYFSLHATLLLPGIAVPRWGGGRTGLAMRVVLAGTGSLVPKRTHQDLEEAARRAVVRWVKAHLRHVQPERHLTVELWLRDPQRVRSPRISVARAPLSAGPYLASEVVAIASSPEFRLQFPEAGEDLEVSALAIGSLLRVSMQQAFVDKLVHSDRVYRARKLEMQRFVTERMGSLPPEFERFEVHLNPEDGPGPSESDALLCVLGTTADGRRPGRAETAADGEHGSENAESFARMIVARIRGVRGAVVRLEEDDRGEIRRAFVRVELDRGLSLDGVRAAISELVPDRASKTRRIDPRQLGE